MEGSGVAACSAAEVVAVLVPRASAFASVAVLEAVDFAFFWRKAGLRPDLEALRSRAGGSGVEGQLGLRRG